MCGATTLPQLQQNLLGDREVMQMNKAPLDRVSTSADLEFKCLEINLMCFGLHPALVNVMGNSLKALLLHHIW